MRAGERMVALKDGREVSNYSEEYRHECEALSVIGMRSFADRQRHLQGVELKRGAAERARLDVTIGALILRMEASRILAMQSLQDRREHLELIECDRGFAARRNIEAEVRRLWEARKAA